jgi:hypothetical protein
MKLEVGHGTTQGYVRVQARGGAADPSTRGDGGSILARVVSNWHHIGRGEPSTLSRRAWLTLRSNKMGSEPASPHGTQRITDSPHIISA